MNTPKYILNLNDMMYKLRQVYPFNLIYEIADCYRMNYAIPMDMLNNSAAYVIQTSVAKLFKMLQDLPPEKSWLLSRRYNDNAPWNTIAEELDLSPALVQKMHVEAITELADNFHKLKVYDEETVMELMHQRNEMYIALHKACVKLSEYRKRYKEDQEETMDSKVYKELMEASITGDNRIKNKLSSKTKGALAAAGIKTLGDLTNISEHDCSKIKNIGVKSIEELTKMMDEFGLSFKKNLL